VKSLQGYIRYLKGLYSTQGYGEIAIPLYPAMEAAAADNGQEVAAGMDR